MLDRIFPLAFCIERDGKVEACLMIKRVGKHLLLKIGQRPDRLRLFGDLERRAGGGNRRLIALGFGNESEGLLRLFERASLDIATREAGNRRYVGAVLGEKLRI